MTAYAEYVVAAGVADIRRDPDADAELVTQALMNAPVKAVEAQGEWTRIILSDYEGWIATDLLEEPIVHGFCKVGEYCGTALPLVSIVTVTHAPLFATAQGSETLGTAYLSTVLPIFDITDPARLQVGLPGERSAWLSRDALAIRGQSEPYPRQAVRVVTDYARQFLGVPYLWGGTSWEGLDCSGFAQLCYRMGGFIIPRDARQQHDFLTHSVERAALQEGDLLFFGTQSITHVAIALNATEYIHAEGQNYNRVLVNSFNPRDPHYYPRLDEIFCGAKRVLEQNMRKPAIIDKHEHAIVIQGENA